MLYSVKLLDDGRFAKDMKGGGFWPNRGVCQEGLRKTKNRQGGRYHGRDLNQTCLECTSRIFPLHRRRVTAENSLSASPENPHFLQVEGSLLFTKDCHWSLF
jgi:hypothetical protein